MEYTKDLFFSLILNTFPLNKSMCGRKDSSNFVHVDLKLSMQYWLRVVQVSYGNEYHPKGITSEMRRGKAKVLGWLFVVIQLLSHVWLFATPWITAHQASLSITNSWNSLRLTSIESMVPSSHLNLSCPLYLLPPIPPSIKVFSSESTLRMRWLKYWSFSFSIIPFKEIPGL